MSNQLRLFAVASSLIAFTACTKPVPFSAAPIVQNVQNKVISDVRPSINPELALSSEVRVTATVDKHALLTQEFFYGADLQYSSAYDADMDLYNQSMALGHIPARFRIAGNELQLISDTRRLYPSDVNHPEQLLSRFQILSQTETTLTLSGANSGVFLAQVFEATNEDSEGSMSLPSGRPPRDLWVRSFEFVPQGNYLLQQTSVVLADGSIGEFMESIFPRSSLAPGADFEAIEMDPTHPAGGDTDLLERFRLLESEPTFEGEKKLTFAQHFDISKTATNPEGTIDWYVTRNITDEQMAPVALAVEGWNRYFKTYQGIERDVVRFKGRLPDGIHLGDPRYNVINWDNRLIAGAAYESQATDPFTGKQSHSLIYMPAAWFQIGVNYWNGGRFSDDRAPAAPSRISPVCVRDIRDAGASAISGRLKAEEVRAFGIELLKGTLFHEVGHALGLAHNFKGSLSFDRSVAGSAFSTSIMDYNDYEIERVAFAALDSADGPLLEYDRQALSAIYNKMKDVRDSDPVVPVCNDEEADNEEDGVDPLCIRYDIEKDPTRSIKTALDRINGVDLPDDVNLTQALARVPGLVLTPEQLAAATTREAVLALVSKVSSGLQSAVQFHLTAGKASVARVVRLNVKSLLAFEEDILPEEYNEREMRERVFSGLNQALQLTTATLSARVDAGKLAAAFEAAPFVQSLGSDQKAEFLREVVADRLRKAVEKVGTHAGAGLPKMKAMILASLARHTDVPFFFGELQGASLDFETAIVGILSDAVTGTGTAIERTSAATALKTFKGRSQGDAALAAVKTALETQRGQARNNESRELVEELLKTLN